MAPLLIYAAIMGGSAIAGGYLSSRGGDDEPEPIKGAGGDAMAQEIALYLQKALTEEADRTKAVRDGPPFKSSVEIPDRPGSLGGLGPLYANLNQAAGQTGPYSNRVKAIGLMQHIFKTQGQGGGQNQPPAPTGGQG